jgi:hypothetical protein
LFCLVLFCFFPPLTAVLLLELLGDSSSESNEISILFRLNDTDLVWSDLLGVFFCWFSSLTFLLALFFGVFCCLLLSSYTSLVLINWLLVGCCFWLDE